MTPTEVRLALKAAGFSPVACIGKAAVLPRWRDLHNATEEEITRWPGGNSGIDTGNTPSFDVDIDWPGAAAAVADLARDWFDGRGLVPVRFSRQPRCALLFRTSQPFKKFVEWFKAPDGSAHKIEVLGEGQQIVVDGIHPDTGKVSQPVQSLQIGSINGQLCAPIAGFLPLGQSLGVTNSKQHFRFRAKSPLDH